MKLFNYVQLREKIMLTDSSHSCIISKHGQISVLNTLLITKIDFIKYFIISKDFKRYFFSYLQTLQNSIVRFYMILKNW